MGYKEVKAEELQFNPFTKIGKEWLLITAGDESNFNTMTASWGGLGVIWGKNAATTYIRPQRYTKEFVDSNDTYTLSFYGEEYKKALGICGRLSGRDTDKVSQAGLTPYKVDDTMAFEEANMIVVCKKLFQQTLNPDSFIETSQDAAHYPNKDYHDMYIGEIIKILIRE